MVVNFCLKAQEYDYTLLNGFQIHLEQGCEKHNAINGHLEKHLKLNGQLNQGHLLSLCFTHIYIYIYIYIYIFFMIVLL